MKTMKDMLGKILEQNKELNKRVTVLEVKVGKKENKEILVPKNMRVSI